jgi:hypothetical protein
MLSFGGSDFMTLNVYRKWGGLGVGVCEVLFSAAYSQFICVQCIFKGIDISKMYSIVSTASVV